MSTAFQNSSNEFFSNAEEVLEIEFLAVGVKDTDGVKLHQKFEVKKIT